MKLVIIKENFDLNRILFRESKTSIKISYNVNHVSMIGITININYEYIIDKGTYMIIKVNEEDRQILSKIDTHLEQNIDEYDKMIINDTIKVKKHKEYKNDSLNKNLLITMNSIKRNGAGRNKVQIFSI